MPKTEWDLQVFTGASVQTEKAEAHSADTTHSREKQKDRRPHLLASLACFGWEEHRCPNAKAKASTGRSEESKFWMRYHDEILNRSHAVLGAPYKHIITNVCGSVRGDGGVHVRLEKVPQVRVFWKVVWEFVSKAIVPFALYFYSSRSVQDEEMYVWECPKQLRLLPQQTGGECGQRKRAKDCGTLFRLGLPLKTQDLLRCNDSKCCYR